jgi:hypothetical protein
VAAVPDRAREVQGAILAVEKIFADDRVRKAQDWRAAANVVGNLVYAATEAFGKEGMARKLAPAVELLLKTAPKVGIGQPEIEQTRLAWILVEAARLRHHPPDDGAA